MKGLFSFCLALIAINCFSQVSFERSYDFNYEHEFGTEHLQTTDNGYLITGGTDGKALLMKTDQFGDVLWQYTYDEGLGANSTSLILCSDNSYVIAGASGALTGSGTDAYIVKIDASGNKLWSKTYNFLENDAIYDIVQTSDGGYLFAGSADFAGFIVRTNASGDIVWQEIYQEEFYHWQYHEIAKTADNQYVVVGTENSGATSGYEVNLIKIDDSGNETWNYTYAAGYGYSVKQTSDNGFIVSGSSNGVYVLKVNSAGIETWSQIFFPDTEDANGYSVTELSSGGYAVLFKYMTLDPPAGGSGILKMNSSGTEIWNRTYWFDIDPAIGNLIETSDGGLSAAGKFVNYDPETFETDNNVYLLKTLSDGSGCFMYVTDVQEICMVTVDNSGLYNKIVWEPIADLPVNGYNVYRESTEGYSFIGYVPATGLSEFVDTNSNPSSYSEKYKLAIVDTCDNVVGMGDFHKTIHLNVSPATPTGFALTWEHYEGFAYSKYRIFRGTSPSTMMQIDSLAASNYTYTDETAPAGVYYYQVAAVKPSACYSSSSAKDVGGPYSQSVSNLEDNVVGEGIEQFSNNNFKVNIYPNPSNGNFNISFELKSPQKFSLSVLSILGEEIYYFEKQFSNSGTQIIPIKEGLSEGFYLLKLSFNDEIVVKEIVVGKN
ncbi:MAG: T9SS type A sorting domain-containing protein [Bacteroidales bacterium]|nr:T9SS type A sorting domain-containing protein [Bacteroidales bacterium]